MKMRWMLRLPRLIRMMAVALFLGLVAALVISYRNNQFGFIHRAGELYPEYRLSRHLVSVTEKIRHLQTQGDRRLFLLTAARDELYDDDHHELKDVSLEVYGDDGLPRGRVRAQDCVYDQAHGLVIFKNRVVATTWQDLSIKTERLVYDQNTGLIQTDRLVDFSRPHLTGRARGVEVQTRRGHEQVIFKRSVDVMIEPRGQSAARLQSQSIRIESDSAYYLKSRLAIHLVGHARLSQATEVLTADRMTAHFDGQNQLRKMIAEGQAVLRSDAEHRTTQVQANTMEFSFDDKQRLQQAVAWGEAVARVVEDRQVRQVRAPRIEASFAPSSSTLSTVTRIVGDHGRVDVRFSPAPAPEPAQSLTRPGWEPSAREEKTLTADWVQLSYRKDSRDLDRAMASGEAVLVLTPRSMSREADRKTIRADRMEIEFYQDGNLAKAFTAHGHVRVEFEPLGTDTTRETRITSSQDLVAQIDRLTQEFVQLTQSGDFHFTEGERQARSEVAVYDADTHIISLDGGEPVMWDPRGRLRAKQLDINMETGESLAEGGVGTTYYNREAANRALPFEKPGSPVFIAARRAEVQHHLSRAIYTGQVRAWQDDNYIVADRIELYERERMMVASGHVRSGFYRAAGRKERAGSPEPVPVFAQARRMTYLETKRLVRYEGQARLRQGSRRLLADRLTVFLKPEVNEIERAVAEQRVRVVEPDRRAFGDQAVYTAADGRIVLIGHPARVEDDRHHLTQRGPRLTYLLGDDKVMAGVDGSSQRVKSVRRFQ